MIKCDAFADSFLGKLNSWAVENCVPFSTTFELTPFCNFRCVMCYVRLDKEQADKQGEVLPACVWIDMARQLRDMGTLKITLTGGEVFMHPQFWEIYSQLNSMGFWITVLSNGSLIDEDVISKFRQYGMPYAVKLTLYGANDETYERVCGVPGGFTGISKAIDLLKAEGVPAFMTATIVKENADDLQEMYLFAKKKGIPFQHSVSVLKSSRGSVNSAETSRLGIVDYSHEYTVDELEMNKNRFPEAPFSMCCSYRKSLFITWNGHLQLCSFMNVPDITYSGSISADFNALYRKLAELKNPTECAECEWKEFCQRCPAILCAESGHPEKISADFCETAKHLKLLYEKKKGIDL